MAVEVGEEIRITAAAVIGDGKGNDGGEVLFQSGHDEVLKHLECDAVRSFAKAVDEPQGRALARVEFGDGGNGSFVHGIIHWRNLHQAPADDAEDIAETIADYRGLCEVELALARESDAEDKVGRQEGILRKLQTAWFC